MSNLYRVRSYTNHSIHDIIENNTFFGYTEDYDSLTISNDYSISGMNGNLSWLITVLERYEKEFLNDIYGIIVEIDSSVGWIDYNFTKNITDLIRDR